MRGAGTNSTGGWGGGQGLASPADGLVRRRHGARSGVKGVTRGQQQAAVVAQGQLGCLHRGMTRQAMSDMMGLGKTSSGKAVACVSSPEFVENRNVARS